MKIERQILLQGCDFKMIVTFDGIELGRYEVDGRIICWVGISVLPEIDVLERVIDAVWVELEAWKSNGCIHIQHTNTTPLSFPTLGHFRLVKEKLSDPARRLQKKKISCTVIHAHKIDYLTKYGFAIFQRIFNFAFGRPLGLFDSKVEIEKFVSTY
jgi:hypothetical protein